MLISAKSACLSDVIDWLATCCNDGIVSPYRIEIRRRTTSSVVGETGKSNKAAYAVKIV